MRKYLIKNNQDIVEIENRFSILNCNYAQPFVFSFDAFFRLNLILRHIESDADSAWLC